MWPKYSIHPSVGVARVGNSEKFYLSPIIIGGRPIECDQKHGDESFEQDSEIVHSVNCERDKRKYVRKFKDEKKMVKKQAAKFRIFKQDAPDSPFVEVDLVNDKEIENVKWTVHLANKKAAWYHFSEFKGDLMLGEKNTYENRPRKKKGKSDDAEKRNKDITDYDERKKLIVDFGPQYVEGEASKRFKFSYETAPGGYPKHSLRFKKDYPEYGKRVDYLGEIFTDSKNNLVVLGGNGNSGGDEFFDTFAGGNSWYDDMSDGPVLCEITLANQKEPILLDAWVIVCPPKFAPELVNISTLDDLMLDVALKYTEKGSEYHDRVSKIYDPTKKEWKASNGWNPKHKVSFEHDIEPIIKRIGGYRWVANIPSMMDFCMPSFSLNDESDENRKNREKFFSFFRKAGEKYWGMGGQSNQLFHNDNYLTGVPLMPLNAGSNAVNNVALDKFVELTRAQHYFLEQWAKGEFTVGGATKDVLGLHPLDHADAGNCVGNPMCPGVEVTWSVKNPAIYEAPYRIKHRKKYPEYNETGLDPDYDETTPTGRQEKGLKYDLNAPIGKQGQGCEPGDLTKRMADPWVSDLFECNINHINFTDKDLASDKHELEAPPTYHAYWWPPQSPWDVILGVTGTEEEPHKVNTKNLPKIKPKVIKEIRAAGASAGQQVNYLRGIHNHIELVYAWSYLGFIVNQNEDPDRDSYPYFVEKERNHEEFEVSAVAISNKINIVDQFNTRPMAAYHLKKDIIEFSESEGHPNIS